MRRLVYHSKSLLRLRQLCLLMLAISSPVSAADDLQDGRLGDRWVEAHDVQLSGHFRCLDTSAEYDVRISKSSPSSSIRLSVNGQDIPHESSNIKTLELAASSGFNFISFVCNEGHYAFVFHKSDDGESDLVVSGAVPKR